MNGQGIVIIIILILFLLSVGLIIINNFNSGIEHNELCKELGYDGGYIDPLFGNQCWKIRCKARNNIENCEKEYTPVGTLKRRGEIA